MAAVGGDARGALDEKARQTFKVAFVEKQEPVLLVLEHILAELGGERRQPLRDRGEPRFGLAVRACA